MNENVRRLWEYLHENSETTPVYRSALEALESSLSPDEVSSVVREATPTAYATRFEVPHLSSPAVATFIGEIAATQKPKSILDPVCGTGILLSTVADSTGATVVHGVEIDENIARAAEVLLGGGASIWVGDSLHADLPLGASYDLIVAEPPFGVRMTTPVAVKGTNTAVGGDFTDVLAAWAASKLSEVGMAVLILPPSFLWSTRSEQAKNAIADLGCAVTACIHLPSESLQGTGMEAYIAIIERSAEGEIFVGQYTADLAHQKLLIKNLVSRKEGRRPAQGRLCPWSDFRGYAAIESMDRIQRLVIRLGFDPIPMRKLVAKATRADRKASEPLEARPNSVYLPLLGRGEATTNQEQLPEKLRDYVQLQLDPDLADARFVTHLLNRELGQAFLESLSSSLGGVPRVLLTDLLEATFYLPPLVVQKKVLASLDQIESIRGEIDELEAALWTDTRRIDQLSRQVETVNREDRFEDWIETLPFPLATILWRYRAASGSPREKYEALLHFFEALAEFLATVHLSAFSSDQEIWSQHRTKLRRTLSEQNLSLERGTFGAWKCVSEYLAARLRRLLDRPSDAAPSLYRTHNPDTFTMLASKELLDVLQQANSVRNDRVGHVGAVSKTQAEAVHDELLSLVQRCRGVLGRSWLNYELIQPAESHFRDGIFHFNVRRLRGTRTPFQSAERDSIEGMEDGALYLFDPNGDRGLRLLPFVRVMPSPKTEANACYFFNRIEGNDKCRYVSYHFAQDAELTNAFEDTWAALRALALADVSGGDA